MEELVVLEAELHKKEQVVQETRHLLHQAKAIKEVMVIQRVVLVVAAVELAL
jgi:hypothetical protein